MRLLSHTRRALTLTELLVVLALILLLAALGYALVPAMFGNQRRAGASDQLTLWLLTARQRAKRDALPTGLRLLPQADDAGNVVFQPDGSVLVRQLRYVQQPEPFTGGSCEGVRDGVATFLGVDFYGGGSATDEYLVQPGDYLELRGGGPVYAIAAVEQTRLLLGDTTVNPPEFAPTASYRVLRKPRPLPGEKVLELSGDVAIDLGPPSETDRVTGQPLSFRPPAPTRSVRVPERHVGGGIAPRKLILEVVFSPTGAVVGPQSGKVILWLRDATAAPPDFGSPSLLVIPVSTGFIGAYDVAPGANPYRFAESGRAAGL
jgi:prepilin-type N-terminal cleavage/methylation domain-containing protein